VIRVAAVPCTLAALAGVALAETAPANTPAPDEIAETEAREANLESNAPRRGLTFGGALLGGIMLGGDIGVGRGPGGSLRVGHVATRKTVITFELVGTGALHKPSTTQTLTDSNGGLFLGAQRYASPSAWVRIAGGPDLLSKNVGQGSVASNHGGIGGLVGAGLDLARWGYLVFGLEAFLMTSVTGDGFKVQLAFGAGLSYY
jgi:hypothetical protein